MCLLLSFCQVSVNTKGTIFLHAPDHIPSGIIDDALQSSRLIRFRLFDAHDRRLIHRAIGHAEHNSCVVVVDAVSKCSKPFSICIGDRSDSGNIILYPESKRIAAILFLYRCYTHRPVLIFPADTKQQFVSFALLYQFQH